MQSKENVQLNIACDPRFRNVTSTAKLFNFRCPVYMTTPVWEDCVELNTDEDGRFGELVVLQRLRHVLFMAASSLQGRIDDFEQEFCVYRVPNVSEGSVRRPHPVNLKLASGKGEDTQSIYIISQQDE